MAANPFEAPRSHASHTPDFAPRGSDGFWVFRCSPWPVLVLAAVITALLDAVYAWLAVDPGWQWSVGGTMFLITLALQAICILTLVRKFPVYASEDGLRCFDLWGHYHFVEWSSIQDVRHRNHCGLRYLKVTSSQTTATLWLPLFLARPQYFAELVDRFSVRKLAKYFGDGA